MANKVLVIMPLSEWSVGDVRIRYPLGRLVELKPDKWEIVVKGVVDLVPEDFALCEFVCPSKIEIQTILRQGLDTIRKEFN